MYCLLIPSQRRGAPDLRQCGFDSRRLIQGGASIADKNLRNPETGIVVSRIVKNGFQASMRIWGGSVMKREAEEAAPDPCAMITSMRAIGYRIETAIADLIDNSITAGAKHIRIRFQWNQGAPWFSMLDDGQGMNEAELVTAMRPGSRDPLLERHKNDLGRFGFGLKTASFSQAKILKVFALRAGNSQIFGRSWDLDYVRKKQSREKSKGNPQPLCRLT